MPTFDQEEGSMMDVYNAKGIAFSGVRPTELGATDYTLVTIVRDKSGSVDAFRDALVKSTREAVKACGLSPRASNLLIRSVDFNDNVEEVHGFKELRQINADKEYDMRCYGSTALHDAVINGVKATQGYAKTLFDNDFGVNAIIFIETDGEENASNAVKAESVKDAIDELMQSEVVESCLIILIGVNAGRCSKYLKNFQTKVGINEYIDVTDFDYKKGAKLAKFVSKSISSQSQALGTGGPSQILTFN
jgi:hypothetical protein